MIFSRRNFLRYILPSAFIVDATLNKSEASPVAIANDNTHLDNNAVLSASPSHYKAQYSSQPDDTAAVLTAINDCIKNNKYLDLRGGPWKISKTLDLTGVKSIITDWSGRLIINTDNFQATNNSNFAVIIGNPDSDYKTDRANYTTVNGLLCIIAEDRKIPLNGLFIKGSLLSFDSIRVIGFNGSGIVLSSVWDSSFKSLSSELCGNVHKYQIAIISGGDTSNCLSIDRIQSERAFHKCLYINAIRSTLNTLHAERTTILTRDDGSSLSSSLKYTNVSITLSNCVLNQVIHDTSAKSNDLSKSEKIVADKSSVVLNLVDTILNSAHLNGCVLSTSMAIRSQFNSVFCESWFFEDIQSIDNSSIDCSNISKTLVITRNLLLQNSNLASLTMPENAHDILIDKCKISNVSISKKITGNILFRSCLFQPEMELLETGSQSDTTPQISLSANIPVSFNDCIFLGKVKGMQNSQAIFKGGFINDADIASGFVGQFYNVQIKKFTFSGEAAFITNQCIIEDVISWSPPKNLIAPLGVKSEIMSVQNGHSQYYSPGNNGQWLLKQKD